MRSMKLRVLSGPQKGQEFPVSPGMVIGRLRADIAVGDPKMSGQHAKIETSSDGTLLLTDLGSTNGIRVNNKRLAQVSLTVGLQIKLGNTLFETLDDVVATAETSPSLPPPVPENKPRGPAWAEYLSDFARSALEKIPNKPAELLPFDPALVMTVQSGPQAGTVWTFGYGPRAVGADTLDCAVLDEGVPPVAFTVRPQSKKAFLEATKNGKVRLNGKIVSAEVLNAGDQISLGKTVLKVSYLE